MLCFAFDLPLNQPFIDRNTSDAINSFPGFKRARRFSSPVGLAIYFSPHFPYGPKTERNPFFSLSLFHHINHDFGAS